MSELSTEQTVDMLPHVVDIYEKANVKEYIRKAKKENKGKKVDIEEEGLDLILYIIKSLSKVKDEVFEVIAIAQVKDIEEVKKQPLSETLKALKELFTDEKLMDFFKEAMQ